MFSPLRAATSFRLVYRSPIRDLPLLSFGVSLVDSQTDRRGPTLLSRGAYSPIASYFVSMRLPILPGVPNVRHFNSLPSSTRLEVAALTWAFLIRLGTESHFLIAPADATTRISHLRLSWIRHTFFSFQLGIWRYS
ncbi:hypothetical protein M5K25_015014 [Dendrobium thyrsiflorum]|uniref:Uncharacterized protein n=1 Tax=Dendrobium thyrsiflorum TaxID=117978 RepID=A0ABD0UPZ6_DENTH